jgi:hypothetical protein
MTSTGTYHLLIDMETAITLRPSHVSCQTFRTLGKADAGVKRWGGTITHDSAEASRYKVDKNRAHKANAQDVLRVNKRVIVEASAGAPCAQLYLF